MKPQASKKIALWNRSLELAKFVFAVSAWRASLTFALQAIGNVTEGFSVVLLLPLFQFIGKGGSSTLLHIPTLFLASFLGPTLDVELWLVLSAFVILIVLIAVFNRFKTVYAAELFSETINTIRSDLFKSIAGAKWFTIATMRKADLDHALTGDIDRVQIAVTSLYNIGQTLVFFALYFCLSALISLKMTLFASAAGLLVFLVQRPIRIFASQYGQRLTQQRKRQYRTIADFLGGLKIAKGFNAEQNYTREFDANLATMRMDIIRFVKITSNGSIVYQAMLGSLMCGFIFLAYVIYKVEFSRIIILLLIFMRISPRLADLQSQFQLLLVNLASFESIQTLKGKCDLDREADVNDDAAPITLKRNLAFSHVTFGYDPEVCVIKDLTFDIPFGSITALAGQSGSGKSTIADLAIGLLVAQTGEIRVDDKPLTDSTRRAWRFRTAYVPQDSHLLAMSVRENVTLGLPTATTDQVRDALKRAQALDFVDAMPQGVETIVGDGGVSLSGGERQRLALARALLTSPDLLILDEVTSALDAENTQRIIETIQNLRHRMTILLISHNAAVLNCASHTVSIDKGELTQPTM